MYKSSSGMPISFPKSETYCSRNVLDPFKHIVTNILDVHTVLGIDKYLGLRANILGNAIFAYFKKKSLFL